jgi:nitronate monooxygenase
LFELKSKVMINVNFLLNINQPLIIAPMFLVSNTKMVIEGMKGVAGCIPALNYRTLEELRASIIELKKLKGGVWL